MARAYDAKLIAHTIAVPFKWVDNLLSHHELPGVARARQGVQRRITEDGLIAIEIVRLLSVELGLAVGRAVAIARGAVRDGTPEVRVSIHSHLAVVIQMADVERSLRERLVEASEAVGRARRGRPRTRGAVGGKQ
jgi:hypothetical protein